MQTYSEIAEQLLAKLCTSLNVHDQFDEFLAVQRSMFEGWGEFNIPEQPLFPSLIGDDHSPFEYSIAFADDKPDVRLLFEVQAATPEALANQRAAIAFNQKLAARHGATLSKFEAIRELFLCDTPRDFSLWHGVRFDSRRPDLKIYVNPQTFGPARALPLMKEALHRLGMHKAVPIIEEVVGSRGGLDELNYFSLDLSGGAARTKVYFRHVNSAAERVEKLFALSPTHRSGDVIEFCEHLVGRSQMFENKPVTSCFAFTEASSEPIAVTFHLPIAHYAPDDATSVSRSAGYLQSIGQPRAAELLSNAVRAFAPRALENGVGVQSYASFRREQSGLRFTAYLSPDLFREADAHRSWSRVRATRAQGAHSQSR